MNNLNYATLEASKKLHDAGIILETDYKWFCRNNTWKLVDICYYLPLGAPHIPAPCFAELLQELKKDVIFYGSNLYFSYQLLEQGFYSNSVKFSDDLGRIESPSFISDNPADALAELLIWVKGQEEEK